MKLALIQEKQNNLYSFNQPDLRFTKDQIMELQKEMIDQNLKMIQRAISHNVDLVLTSEAINFVGNPYRYQEKPYDLVVSSQDYLLEACAKLAKQGKTYLVVGMLLAKEHQQLSNSAVVFNKNGQICFAYDKVFLAGDENDYLRPGSHFPIWDSEFGKVGIAICYDMQFPETIRAYAKQGADLILCPTWGWENIYARCRAYENGIYLASAMAVPFYKDITDLRSPSEVIGPNGQVLACAGNSSKEILFYQINDIRDCKRQRELRQVMIAKWQSFSKK